VVSGAFANTEPTVVIQSAAMRAETTLMDVVYRVNDPDDATVKTRALAFVDGVRSFTKVLKPVTFVEGTAANLGDAIATNVDHTLTWDVATDWEIDLGQVKFEVLAMDGRGLMPFDWITIPAAGGSPALTISKDAPSRISVLDALFWRYASGDSGLSLASGSLYGTVASGIFNGLLLAQGSSVETYATPYVLKQMDLSGAETVVHAIAARAGITNSNGWHAELRPWSGITPIISWGRDNWGEGTPPAGTNNVIAIAARGNYSLALKSDGKVVLFGSLSGAPPTGLTGVTAIAAGNNHSLALKSDGTVVGWGQNSSGQVNIPANLTGVIAICAGYDACLALKSDGTVVGWGSNSQGQISIPGGLAGVTAISIARFQGLALKSDGTVVGWGSNNYGQVIPPAGLTSVMAIAAGEYHSLAIKTKAP